MREAPRRRLDSLLALIDDFDREIDATTSEIDQRAKADDRVDVLCQIRGVGPYTAMLIIAEVGDDRAVSPTPATSAPGPGSPRPSAAPTAKPASATSPGKARRRSVGPWSRPRRSARPAAARCASSSNGSPNAAARKIAKVAVARQILTLSYYGLRDGEIRCLARRSRASAKEKLAAA